MSQDEQARRWIDDLHLQPHPEGGFFREVYRSRDIIPKSALPPGFRGDRSLATSIFYLLGQDDFSAFHRILSDETWHFYAGGPLELYTLSSSSLSVITLGTQPEKEQQLQYTIPARTWFAARPCPGTSYTLAGCCVSPGFDFDDFEMGDRDALCDAFPHAAEVIRTLTRVA